MLVMRLRRIGRKSDPHYRIVVAEHTAPVQGKFLAEVGHYHPKSKELVFKTDLVNDWLAKGVQVSNTVARLCAKAGITNDRIVVKQLTGAPKKKAQELEKAKADKAEQAKAAAAAPAEEAPADEVEATDTEEVAEVSDESVDAETSETTADESTDEVTESQPDAEPTAEEMTEEA